MLQFLTDIFNAVKSVVQIVAGIIEAVIASISGINDLFAVFNMGVMAQRLNQTARSLIVLNGPANKIYDALLPAAFAFIFIYFCIHMVDLVLTDQYDIEHYLKALGYLIFGMLVINNGYRLLWQVYLATEQIAAQINTRITGSIISNALSFSLSDFLQTFGATDIEALVADIIFSPLKTALLFMFTLPLIVVIFIFYVCYMQYIIYKRALMLGVTMAVSPIAFANLFGDSPQKSQAFRHFKRIISLFLQAPVIIIVVRISWYLVFTSAVNNLGFSMPIQIIAFLCIIIANVKKTERLSLELIDY